MSSKNLPDGRLLVLLGIVLPFIHGLLVPSAVPSWQTGKLEDLVATYFDPSVEGLFFPWFVFAAMSLGAIVSEPASASYTVRLGLFSGVVLSARQIVICSVVRADIAWFFLLLTVPLLVVGALVRYRELGCGLSTVLIFSAPAIPLVLDPNPFIKPSGMVVLWMLVVIGCAPLFSFMAYAYLLAHAFAQRPNRRRHPLVRLGFLPWLAAYLGTEHLALEQVEKTYRSLPTQPPTDCYVSAAAASGHSWLVGSKPLPSGRVVNRQMLILKAAELVLADRTPRLHRRIRRIYDTWGPRLARKLHSALRADAAYLALKPFEWLACGLVVLSSPRLRPKGPRGRGQSTPPCRGRACAFPPRTRSARS